jgi:hypothetical protein
MAGHKRTEAAAEGFGKETIISEYVALQQLSFVFTTHVEPCTAAQLLGTLCFLRFP